ncbi:hypothetical protein AAFF_G00092120 [Aldrovandia affinis]|uniref:Uncharacterized protein n=1 Tax=Aldrovandia affinis TaxID=143900 RepID=A0AAD7WXG3_9TELE|nr:hypothetical protein AAFF_G00092120 [Aldrovandia affinis]
MSLLPGAVPGEWGGISGSSPCAGDGEINGPVFAHLHDDGDANAARRGHSLGIGTPRLTSSSPRPERVEKKPQSGLTQGTPGPVSRCAFPPSKTVTLCIPSSPPDSLLARPWALWVLSQMALTMSRKAGGLVEDSRHMLGRGTISGGRSRGPKAPRNKGAQMPDTAKQIQTLPLGQSRPPCCPARATERLRVNDPRFHSRECPLGPHVENCGDDDNTSYILGGHKRAPFSGNIRLCTQG